MQLIGDTWNDKARVCRTEGGEGSQGKPVLSRAPLSQDPAPVTPAPAAHTQAWAANSPPVTPPSFPEVGELDLQGLTSIGAWPHTSILACISHCSLQAFYLLLSHCPPQHRGYLRNYWQGFV